MFEAPRHRPLTIPIRRDAGQRVALGRSRMDRYETLAGRIVEAGTDAPLAAVSIERSDGTVLAHTDTDGAFELDIDAELAMKWPTALHVRAPGRGRKILTLPTSPRGRRWDRLELAHGGAIEVHVRNADDRVNADVALELRRHRGGEPDAWESVGRAVATPNGPPQAFSDLDPGTYTLTCSGRGPLEHLAVDVAVKPGDVTHTHIDIRPVNVRLTVERGRRAVTDATVRVGYKNHWNDSVAVPSGVHESLLWQRGALMAFVTLPRSGVHVERKVVEGDADQDWLIHVPERSVRGHVRERGGARRPIPDAVVILERGGDKQAAKTDAAGAYHFDLLEAGSGVVRVLATDRFMAAATEITLRDGDTERRVDFDLSPATLVKVKFIAPTGAPAAKAKIYDETQPDVLFQADDAGELLLRLAPGETRRIFVVPWHGAFDVVRVTAAQTGAEQSVVAQFAEGPATLSVSANDEGGKPISGVWFQLRYNGTLIPTEVLQWIAARDGNQLATSADGRSVLTGMPAGVYELWPVTSPRESGASRPAPVRFTAHRGDHPIRLTFTHW